MRKQKKIAILILTLIGIFQSAPALAHFSKIPGSTFPNTCAASMAFVPEGDASWDTHNGGKSYVFSEEYKNAVSTWKTANLTDVTIANVSADHLGLPIYVHKEAAAAFTNFGKDLLNCEEIKQGLYSIEIFDNFACRLITKGTTLSPHASGYAIDINVTKNEYHPGQCVSSDCDFSPCFLAALKKNGLSWGGPGDSLLFPGTCDTQHIQWTGKASNVQESNLNFCALKPEIAALYGAGTTLPTGEVVKSVTVDTGIPLVNEVNLILQKPQTKIGLPGLNFSDIKAVEEDGGQFLYIPFLGEYIAAGYKYAVVIASIFAVVMIINQGFGWAISGGEPEKINHAKTRILQSIVGLFLAVGSYILLYTINPNLVSFKSLRVQYVAGVTLNDTEQFLATFGSEGPDSGMVETITGGTPGSWRNNAFSSAVCGDKQGLNLSVEERKKRLINIIKNWKNIAADQGGAIYVHGGGIDCSYSNPSSAFVLNQMLSLYINKKDQFPAGFFDTACGKLLEQLIKVNPNLVLTKGLERQEVIKKMIDVPKNLELASKCNEFKLEKGEPTNFYPSFQRTGGWRTVYDLLLTKKAKANGLLCGDCGSFMVGLFHNCFDKKLLSKHIKEGYITKPSTISINKMDIAVFKKNISAYVSKLRFGDMIRVTGHYLLYTGKSGDPAIDFEVLEMGGYGRGEYIGQKKAQQNTGTPFDSSGVTAHKSIEKYFERRSGTIIAAWSVLDQL